MNVFLDTNILLDIGLSREPFHEASESVLTWCLQNVGYVIVAWHTVTNTYYIMSRNLGDAAARSFLVGLSNSLVIAPTGIDLMKSGLRISGGDLEDTWQYLSAKSAEANVIITRNTSDFASSTVPAVTPTQFLKSVYQA